MPPHRTRAPNNRLRALLAEAGWTHHTLARAVNTLGAETGNTLRYDRSAVSHWVAGTDPRDPIPTLIAEALSRKIGHTITPTDVGYHAPDTSPDSPHHTNPDPVTSLIALTSVDLETAGHAALRRSIYRLHALTVPGWSPARPDTPSTPGNPHHIHAARHMLEIFAAIDHHFGGGHARTALIAYLAHDLTRQLRAPAPDTVHSGLFSVAAELTYLTGFRCFDTLEHGLAQRYYLTALRLATHAGDPIRYAVILRGLSQQAHYLGHHHKALTLITTALTTLARTATTTRPGASHVEATLHLQAAVCHAALGHHDAALGHRRLAKHHLQQATDPAPIIGSCPAGELAYYTAYIHQQLHGRDSAITALQAALRQYPTAHRRSRALALTALAQLYLTAGHLTPVRALLQRLRTDCAPLRSARVATALTALHRQLPIPIRIGSNQPHNSRYSATASGTASPKNCRYTGKDVSVAVATTPDDTSHIAATPARRRTGMGLSRPLAEVLTVYRAALAQTDLSDNTRRGYGSRIAGFLKWLATKPDLDANGDPLVQPAARDSAVRDYQSWLKTIRHATRWTINAHLTALNHFYAHHLGLGAPVVARERITQTAP